jgi:hypothetical protein
VSLWRTVVKHARNRVVGRDELCWFV